MRQLSPPRSQRGFTLIELIIAVALSTLVGALIYTVFINQTRAYRAQADMGTMQQNLRVAMEMLSRDVSMAGFGTSWNGQTWGSSGHGAAFASYAGSDSDPIYSMWIQEDFPPGSGHDAIEVMMMNPNRNTWAWAMGDVQDCGISTLTFHADYAAQAAQYDPTLAAQVMCFQPHHRGKPGAFLWDVIGAGTAGQVPVATNNQSDYSVECTETLPQRLICAPPRWVAFYIDDDNTDGVGIGSATQPVLYYVPDVQRVMLTGSGQYPDPDDIPIALGIEDLQAEVCLGGTGLDCQDAASWTSGFDMRGGLVEWTDLTAVRLHVVARTVRPDPERTNVSAPVDADPDDGFSLVNTGVSDGYHRRLGTTEVNVRNAVGAWQIVNAGW